MEAGEILLKRGLLDPRQLEMARKATGEGVRLIDAVVQLGLLKEGDALRAIAMKWD